MTADNRGVYTNAETALTEWYRRQQLGGSSMFEIRETDILVIGGGGAGMRAAIAAAEMGKQVILLSKGPLSRTGITPVAGEGVEGAVNEGDTPEFHYRDTLTAGRGLADENLVYALAQDSVARIQDLESYGARFKKKPDGSYATSLRPGQSHSRNLFIIGGGYGFASTLARKLAEFPNVMILDDVIRPTSWPRAERSSAQFTSTYGQARCMPLSPKPRFSPPAAMRSCGRLPTLLPIRLAKAWSRSMHSAHSSSTWNRSFTTPAWLCIHRRHGAGSCNMNTSSIRMFWMAGR